MEYKPLRIGIVGCGNHATKAIYPNLTGALMKLVAVCDIDKEKAESHAIQYNAEAFYTDYHEMFRRDDLEAILICGHPVEMHYKIAMDSMKAGYHTYTEKPPSRSAAQSYEAWQVSQDTGRILMAAFKKRYSFAYPKVKKMIDDGILGNNIVMNVNYQKGKRANFVTDSNVHIMDLVRYLMGDVESVVSYHMGSGDRITYLVNFWFENGSMGMMETSSRRTFEFPWEKVELTGDDGYIIVTDTVDVKYFVEDKIKLWLKPNFISKLPRVTGMEDELFHFTKCVREGKSPLSDAWNSYKDMQLCEAVRDSEGEIIKLAK